MIAARTKDERTVDRLPPVRGSYTEGVELSGLTWFRVGGPAEVLFRPADTDDLVSFLKHKPGDVPVTVIGVGSNLLVRDGGVPGVVVRLGREFANVEVEGAEVCAGAAVLLPHIARACGKACVEGLEFLYGVPGTLGGGLRMNAGAFGSEIRDVVAWAETVDPKGGRHRLDPEALGFSYRHCSVPEGWIFTEAGLRGRRGETRKIEERMRRIRRERERSQPLGTHTGGSTFKNPAGRAAWELIAEAGCRGLARGGAVVSKKHCNFLINTGTATSEDLEELGEEVRRRVRKNCGVELDWEIRRVGVPTDHRVLRAKA